MNVSEAIEILSEEYDGITQLSSKKFRCYLEYIDETHLVTLEGCALWAYNEATNHTWRLN